MRLLVVFAVTTGAKKASRHAAIGKNSLPPPILLSAARGFPHKHANSMMLPQGEKPP